jgi:hypothetical protein
MLVYGRQEYQEPLGTMLAHLAQRAARTHADSLDELRMLLIQTGQLEQGVEDLQEPVVERRVVQSINKLTEHAAILFLRAWNRTANAPGGSRVNGNVSLAGFCSDLQAIQDLHAATLTIKIPEGFEYYALFPEQYCLAALRWAADHTGTWPKSVLVVGIRSIGTSLSALVAAVLAGQGWQVPRRTVRPTGHPFTREVALDQLDIKASPCAVVVDEGPGLSGSSMAATARALAAAGIRDISFLPGHAGEPGSAASPETQRWWAATPRYVAQLADLRWNGLSLRESLAARSPDLRAAITDGTAEDLSGGLWRRRVFPNETDWPAAVGRFERTKYLCSGTNGASTLWKFAGLGCCWAGGKTSHELGLEQIEARTKLGLVPEVLGSFRGFISMPWIDGTRLGPGDLRDSALLAHTANYIRQAAGPPLEGAEAQASLARLKEMLYVNTKESLGESLAERTRCWVERIQASKSIATYGDGRLAPHEWVRTRSGAILKTDPAGHALDHTLVGKQPLLWDVAGLLVEWDLDREVAASLLCSLSTAGIPVPADELIFYEMSYAAFRMGVLTLCAGEVQPGTDEQDRLAGASARHRARLEQLAREATAKNAENTKMRSI